MALISRKQERGDGAESRRELLAALLVVMPAVTAVVLAIGGHVITATRSHTLGGATLFALALMLFLATLRTLTLGSAATADKLGDDARWTPLVRSPIWRLALLANSVILAGVAYWAFAGNRLDSGFGCWIAAVSYFVVGSSDRPVKGWLPMMAGWWRSLDWRSSVILVAITAIAVFFRFFRLDALPIEMTSDHAEKLLDVYDVLGGLRPIFFTRNTGREAVQFYLTAALIDWTPLQLGHLALKVGTALVGVATVPATYLLGKELYGRGTGLMAAFFIAVSHWHVTISRIGLRFPFTAAFAAPALYFLFRALRTNRRNDWLAAGLLLGAGLHTYTAMRIVPLLFLILVAIRVGSDLAAYIHCRRTRSRSDYLSLRSHFWVNAVWGAGGALMVFLPLLRYMVDNPGPFWHRAASRGMEGLGATEAWGVFWHNVKNALLMFNYRGDVVPMNTIPESAVLGPVIGGMFVLGLGYLLWQLLANRERRACYVLVSFFVLLLPSVLSLAFPGENPSVVRTGGAIPVIMIIAALPLILLLEYARSLGMQAGELATGLVATTLLAAAVAYNYDWYFDRYDANIRRSIWNATEVGAVLREFEEGGGSLENAFHIAYPHWVDTRNIAINAGDITWHNAVTELAQIHTQASLPGRKLYLVHPAHEAALKVLKEVYPQGMARLHLSERPGKQFYVFEVPAPDS